MNMTNGNSKESGVRTGILPWLARRFAGDDGTLWWRKRDWPVDTVRQSLPETLVSLHGNGSADPIGTITARLGDQARTGRPPAIDEDSRALLCAWMVAQHRRTAFEPDAPGAPVAARLLEATGLCLFTLRHPGLLLGHPSVLAAGAPRTGTRPGAVNSGLVCPIAPDVLLWLVLGPERRELAALDEDAVFAVNLAIARDSAMVAARDPDTIRTVSRAASPAEGRPICSEAFDPLADAHAPTPSSGMPPGGIRREADVRGASAAPLQSAS